MDNRYLINLDQFKIDDICETNLLVLGSGVAGLYTALKTAMRGYKVTIVTKDFKESNTRYAQGGIAAVLDSINDSYQDHITDTLNAGAGLCDKSAVEVMAKEGPKLVKELMELGTHFDTEDGSIHLTKEGGHSHRRVLHSDGDQTGKEIARSLQEAVINNPLIDVQIGFAIDLVTKGNRCNGAIIMVEDKMKFYISYATVIATGGLGQIYKNTTNPTVATSDGIAMAYRAGADMRNMGLVQFHPTALCVSGKPTFLISEAVRGEGAILLNSANERFMKQDKYKMAELEPRDIVAKEIVNQISKTNHNSVYLNVKPLADKGINFSERFPYIFQKLKEFDIDLKDGIIPVAPAAHYAMGGIAVDINGRTSIDCLYASGEGACAALHGANRLASNSLLDGLVFSNRIAIDFDKSISKKYNYSFNEFNIDRDKKDISFKSVRKKIKHTMWENAGLIRSEDSLLDSINDLSKLYPFVWQNHNNVDDFETVNMWTTAMLVARSALWRRESRGSHYREDYPEQNDKYLVSDIIRR
ncbi:MAG: L-aspartate oxidase [Clostridia bacterium]